MILIWWHVCISFVCADGVVIVDPDRQTNINVRSMLDQPQPLTVKYHRVSITINNRIAKTTIDQVFKNSYDRDLEGTYLFPIPESSTISDFALYMNGKKISGEILEKDEARKIYEDIVRRMKDPGLLEYVGRNMFKARIYPIPAHGETKIQLEYIQTIEFDDGIYRYVYPLNTERFSPLPLEEVTITADIHSSLPMKNIYSPSHRVDVSMDMFEARVGYESNDVKPDRDFVLYYSVSRADIGMSLLSYKKHGEDGYFAMLLSTGDLETEASPKDIVFILDTSGSMNGRKLIQAKQALRFCLSNLKGQDRFNLIGFSTGIHSLSESLIPVNEENINRALLFVERFKARGGTNINGALLTGLELFRDSENPGMIIFLTDGEPTVGVTDIGEILHNIELSNHKRTRVFVFGVGTSVNTHLLDKIAEDQRGLSEYVLPTENIEVKVSSFYRKISEPILTDVTLDFGKAHIYDIYPQNLGDIFNGTQLIVMGRYESGKKTSITLDGRVEERKKVYQYDALFNFENTENDFLPLLWATRKIGYLMGEIRLKGEREELVDEIVKLSTEYGIMTPYTSFLVLESDTDYNRWGIERGMEPQVMKRGRTYKSAMESASGEEAVRSSMDISDMKGSTVAEAPEMETVKHVGDRVFYLRGGVWVDREYNERMKVQTVKYLSARFFNLMEKKPALSRYFSVAKNIIVVFENKCYRVEE
jgi:Ca-activated chloride channel family protein